MRLFVAMDIPEDVRSAIAALIARLRPLSQAARWVRIEGMHVTLKFIGETSPEKAEEIKAALVKVTSVSTRAPIAMHFRGLGFFPNERRPRVLWVGIEAGAELIALASAVESALALVGIPNEDRPFSPHLTLARLDPSRGIDGLQTDIKNAGTPKFGHALAHEFHLYQSILKRGEPEYTRLATFSFSGRKSA